MFLMRCLLTSMTLLFVQCMFAQNYLKPNEYYHRLVNGLQLMIIENHNATDIHLLLVINGGASHENKLAQGTAKYAAAFTFQPLFLSPPPGCRSEVRVGNDYTSYQATLESYQSVPQLFKTLVTTLSSPSINYAPHHTISDISLSYITDNTSVASLDEPEKRAISIIFNEHAFRTGASTAENAVSPPELKHILSFKNDFYCPQNAFLVVHGKVNRQEVYKLALSHLLNWKECTSVSAHTTPFGFIRTHEFNLQQIAFSTETEDTRLTLVQAGPVTFKSRKDVLCALVVQSLLENESSTLQQYLRDTLHIKKALYSIAISKYAQPTLLTFLLDSASLLRPLTLYSKIMIPYDSSLITPNDLIAAQKHTITTRFSYRDNIAYLTELGHSFATFSIDYFQKIADSIHHLTRTDICRFIKKYISDNHFAAILHIPKPIYHKQHIDTLFAETAPHPSMYEFFFARNTNNLIGNADSLIISLAQWLKINPTQTIKINGVAVKDELLMIRDNEMIRFYRNHPHFRIMPESLIPTRTIRLDVYRSMTIVKKLYEKGVPLYQLSGTGKIITPEEAQKEQGTRVYCTIKIL